MQLIRRCATFFCKPRTTLGIVMKLFLKNKFLGTFKHWNKLLWDFWAQTSGPLFSVARIGNPGFLGRNENHVIYWDTEVIWTFISKPPKRSWLAKSFFNFCWQRQRWLLLSDIQMGYLTYLVTSSIINLYSRAIPYASFNFIPCMEVENLGGYS